MMNKENDKGDSGRLFPSRQTALRMKKGEKESAKNKDILQGAGRKFPDKKAQPNARNGTEPWFRGKNVTQSFDFINHSFIWVYNFLATI